MFVVADYILTQKGFLPPSEVKVKTVLVIERKYPKVLLSEPIEIFNAIPFRNIKLNNGLSVTLNSGFISSLDGRKLFSDIEVGDKLTLQTNLDWKGSLQIYVPSKADLSKLKIRGISNKVVTEEEFYYQLGINLYKRVNNMPVTEQDNFKPEDLLKVSSNNIKSFINGFFSKETEFTIKNQQYLGIEKIISFVAPCVGFCVLFDNPEKLFKLSKENYVTVESVEDVYIERYYDFKVNKILLNGIVVHNNLGGFGS